MRFRRAILILLSMIVTITGLEALLRLFPLPLPDRFFEPNPDFGWFHIPGRTGWQATPELRTHVTINSQGLRDSEHSYQKPLGVYRILLLGDSFAEGLQVPLESTVGKRLEARLAERSMPPYEVINAGVSRFGTDNELLFYEFEGFRYQPDLVILLFFYNDLLDNLEKPYYRLIGGELTPVEPKPVDVLGPGGQLRGWMWDHFQVYRLATVGAGVIQALVGAGPGLPGNDPDPFYREPESPEVEAAWSLATSLLQAIDRQVREDGAQFVVVGIAEPGSVAGDVGTPGLDPTLVNRRLGAVLQAAGIIYIDLLPGFRAEVNAGNGGLFWVGDGHWNAAGHDLAADLIYAGLLEQGILEP